MILWTMGPNLESESALYKSFRSIAKSLKGQLTFVTANNEEAEVNRITNFFDLKEAPKHVPLVSNDYKIIRTPQSSCLCHTCTRTWDTLL